MRMRMVRAVVVACAVVLSLPAASASAKRARKGTLVSGQVYLRQYSCLGDPQPKDVPFTGAAIVLDRPGNAIPAVAWLDSRGRFSARVGGHGKHVDADLILQDRQHLVKVIPEGANKDTYRIGIWLDPGRNSRLVLTGSGADAANVFLVGLRAAKYTRAQHIVVPEATFRVHNTLAPQNDQDGSYYVAASKTIEINDWRGNTQLRNAWEPFTITHEYGHHVLAWTAPPPSQPGGYHEVDKTYPAIPALAYNEGFAHAFAAVVLGHADLGYGCTPFMHLGWVPAQPLADKPAYAQFNETAAGAAMYQVMSRIGLHDFVEDMVNYKGYAGHFPDDMRQVREALVPSEHGSPAQHVLFDQLFGQQNLRWGTLITLTHEPLWDGTIHGTDAYYEVHLTLTGPYGSCEVNAKAGQYGADPSGPPSSFFTPPRPTLVAYGTAQYNWDSALPGALPFTWQDECLVNTADGYISPDYGPITEGVGGVYAEVQDVPSEETLFPYLAGAAQHKGPFTLSATYVCVMPRYSDDSGESAEPDPLEQEQCEDGAFSMDVYNGLVKGLDDKFIANHYGSPGPDNKLTDANVWTTIRVGLGQNAAPKPLVTWSGNGTCTILVDHSDCGTATIAR